MTESTPVDSTPVGAQSNRTPQVDFTRQVESTPQVECTFNLGSTPAIGIMATIINME